MGSFFTGDPCQQRRHAWARSLVAGCPSFREKTIRAQRYQAAWIAPKRGESIRNHRVGWSNRIGGGHSIRTAPQSNHDDVQYGFEETRSLSVYSKLASITPLEEQVVGRSTALQNVMNVVRIIAKSDSVTLIQGETGTGKEVIAQAIHNQSSRSRGPFVKLNCAAIPGPLLESELFGHERGAFTGAVTQTKGRFQQADNGTLFLDEIGDLPLELQPKLLRVLQEQEFERLGSGHTIRVNVRVVAATNQDLAGLVSAKQFRADLYYRLNVIPIYLPPLRERADDIPELVEHFIRKFSARLNKFVDGV